VGFEPKISAGERPQTYPLDRAAAGTTVKGDERSGNKLFLNSALPAGDRSDHNPPTLSLVKEILSP